MLVIMTFSNKVLVDSPASLPIPTSPPHSLFSYLYKMTQASNTHNAKSSRFSLEFLGIPGDEPSQNQPLP